MRVFHEVKFLATFLLSVTAPTESDKIPWHGGSLQATVIAGPAPYVMGRFHRWSVDSPHSGPVMRKAVLCHYVIVFAHALFCLKGEENFALFRPATQSSTFVFNSISWEASLAVDGGTVDGYSASATALGDLQPWWKVQLASTVQVTRVEISTFQSKQVH